MSGTIPTTISDITPVITPPTTQTDTTVIPTKTPIITPTIPPSPDYTPASPDYSPASDSESDPSEDPLSDHIPPLLAISPFLSSDDDTTDSDTPDTPPSPTYDTPFTKITSSTQRSHVIPRRRVMILVPGQPIPHSRPYHYHLNRSVHMMTARKRVRPLPTHRLTVRYYVYHSSSDSSSDASSNFHSDASSDSSLRHSLPDHPSPDLPNLSSVHVDLIPSPKRIRSPETATDLEDCSEDSFEPYVPREVGLGVDVEDESSEPSRSRGANLEMDVDVVRSDGIKIDPKIQAEIDECFAYAVALRDRGIDARVVVEAVDRKENETGEGPEAIPVHRIQVIEGVQREQGHRIVGVKSAVTALIKRVDELERDNRRLRDTASVESQRVDRHRHGMSRMQRELRQIRRFRFYDRKPDYRRVAEEMEARKATMNLEPLNENRGNKGNGNGGNGGNGDGGNRGNINGGNEGNGNGGNGENRNGNRNRNHGMNYRGFMPVARECTFQDFWKCKPHNFSRTEGVVGLTRWFEKMENITIGIDVAYAMNWVGLMRLMTEVYCPRNEIQKMETELWNLTVKGNDLTAYTQRFQELILLCTRMVPDEEDRVERFIGGLADNIQGNVLLIIRKDSKMPNAVRLIENGGNGGNGNGGNGENENGNKNGNHPTEGVVRLTRWFEKMETVFNISNCPSKYQVKYATCTLQDSALTWWNSYKRTIGVDAAYVMNWAGLIRLMTEVYCPRNEIQKMETELWNLTVKGNDLTTYTQRFQELILLCTRMVPDEEDRVERFIGGLPDNIQGNVIAANSARL
ncbi:putative reverse transcriptase domain-containing protein [Tanacetum coccineum]